MACVSIIKTEQQPNKILQILDCKRPPFLSNLSTDFKAYILLPFFLCSPFPLLLVKPPGRRNSDSEDEDGGSFRSSTIFSRLEKAEHRLASNDQRPSLLLALATKHAMRSRDSHAARRTSSALEESRCTCLHELPACGWPQTPSLTASAAPLTWA